MNYEKDIQKLNLKFVDKFIKKYKQLLYDIYVTEKNINIKVEKILFILYTVLYKTDYFYNIVEYVDNKDKILTSLNSLNQMILKDDFVDNVKINEFLKLHKPTNLQNKFLNEIYDLYFNIVQPNEFKIQLKDLKNKIENFDYDKINLNILVTDNSLNSLNADSFNSSLSRLIEDFDYEIDKESDFKILLNYQTYKFLIKRLKNKTSRFKLTNDFTNQMLKIKVDDKEDENLLYYIINFHILKNLCNQNNKEQYLIDFDFKNINKFIKLFNEELNNNYIKNYITLFETYKPDTNIMSKYDLDFYLHQYKKTICSKINNFSFEVIFNYVSEILSKFNIVFETIDNLNKFNVFYKNQKQKILIAQWQFIFNPSFKQSSFKILLNRIKTDQDSTNIVYLRFEIDCTTNEINIKSLDKLFGFIGKAVYYSLNFNDSLTTIKNKSHVFKSFFKSLFFDNIENILDENQQLEIKDNINVYLNSNFIFKYKRQLLNLAIGVETFHNRKFLNQVQQIINKNDDENIKNVNEMFVDIYNKIFVDIYKTENYNIKPYIFNVFDNLKINTPIHEPLNKIYSDIIAAELFYNYKIKKLNNIQILDYINDNQTIQQIIKRNINFKTLIYGTIENKQTYSTMTEGLNKIIDSTTAYE